MTSKVLARLIIAVLCALLTSSSGAFAESGRHEVLILHSYHPEYKWTDDITAGVKSKLTKSEGFDLFIEYLDSEQFFSIEYRALQKSSLAQKYKNTTFDLIITVDRPALAFVLENRVEVFSDTPIVFCGIPG